MSDEADMTGGAPGGTAGITPLGHEVFEIDTRMAGYRGITAGYLIRSDRPCLVETGTAPSAPVVRDALATMGVGPGDLATVVVTHIHLDHAGGVGDIAKMYPSARVVVHTKGARHLADPSRLMASARLVYGDALDTLFGALAPTPAERIETVEDTGVIDLGGGRRLDSHYSPGHAKHHVGLLDSASDDLYVGDAAGVYLPETGDLRPRHRRRISTSTSPWRHCGCSGRCAPSACCSATTGRSARWTRRWNVRPRRSRSGWRKPARRIARASIWTTRWPWCTSAPKTVTGDCGTATVPAVPTRPRARS